MAKVSKRLKALRSSIEANKLYAIDEAIALVKKQRLLNLTSLLTYLSTWVLIHVNLTKLSVVQLFCLKVLVKQPA
ncbi:50S ribosomal protein L1 [Neisseria elongata subsp. glycolytica ATCC 29315]|uniref:50S ribosomal protein L1 n=1 Tax=Neisseria elongata subsp. glycolytica ATCC 29315 TaxID=546263 RepID=D4DMD4_NEIEG|nr:50S ribosomal protein L1 [Neisseria elongata subsp. glycolytica ATCC 29315]